MTIPFAAVTTAHPLAGFEFSPGEVAALLAGLAIVVLTAVTFTSFFVAALITSAADLRSTGRLRHSWLVVVAPVAALFAAWELRRDPLAADALVVAGIAAGYAVMFWSGRAWFRWTALPVLFFISSFLVAR